MMQEVNIQTMLADPVTRDLAQKAGVDCRKALELVIQLCNNNMNQAVITYCVIKGLSLFYAKICGGGHTHPDREHLFVMDALLQNLRVEFQLSLEKEPGIRAYLNAPFPGQPARTEPCGGEHRSNS